MNNIKSIISLNGMCQSTIKWRLTDLCNYSCSYCIRAEFGKSARTQISLKENEERIFKALPEIARIIQELPGNVKLDLIGGECSLLNLYRILEEILKVCGDKLKRINLTTNMFRDSSYYNDLVNLADSYGSWLGITCSWHSEFVSLEEFMKKFGEIKSPYPESIRAECVSRIDNQEDIKKFIDICEQHNYVYFVERNLQETPENKEKLMVKMSSKKTDRYKVVCEDGTERLYKTRNDFITTNEEGNKLYVKSWDYYCSRDYDYVYIEIDKHMGRLTLEDTCKQLNDIKDFHPLPRPSMCQVPRCTLCGQISLSKEWENLKK